MTDFKAKCTKFDFGWGGAPAEIEFGAFSLKIRQLVATILMIFLESCLKFFCGPTTRGPQELGGRGSLNRLNYLRFLRHCPAANYCPFEFSRSACLPKSEGDMTSFVLMSLLHITVPESELELQTNITDIR